MEESWESATIAASLNPVFPQLLCADKLLNVLKLDGARAPLLGCGSGGG